MTYEQGIEFFSRYGNVSSDIEDLKRIRPSQAELDDAMRHAIMTGQSEIIAKDARDSIINHHKYEIKIKYC